MSRHRTRTAGLLLACFLQPAIPVTADAGIRIGPPPSPTQRDQQALRAWRSEWAERMRSIADDWQGLAVAARKSRRELVFRGCTGPARRLMHLSDEPLPHPGRGPLPPLIAHLNRALVGAARACRTDRYFELVDRLSTAATMLGRIERTVSRRPLSFSPPAHPRGNPVPE